MYDTATGVSPPRRMKKWPARLLAVLVFVAVVIVLILGPEAIEQWQSPGEFSVRSVEIVEFEAMPAGMRDLDAFSLQTPDGRVQVRCTPILPAKDESLQRYRCERTARQRSSAPGYRELMPKESGWLYRRVETDASSLVVDIDQSSAGWWKLPAIALAALGLWWLRRSATPEPKRAFRSSLGWVAAMLALDLLLSYLLSPWVSASDAQIAELMQREVRRQPWLLVAQMVIFGPVLEELVFRGLGWALLRRVFPLAAVVALTTTAFVLGHSHDWATTVAVTSSGLILAWIRIRTGSVLWCIGAHSAMNAMTLLFWYFAH
jgi:membrane protease YdiL (CAAX protease family)